jgi:AraC-like DNA-binding protein
MNVEIVPKTKWPNFLLSGAFDFSMNTCRCDYLNSKWHIPRETLNQHLVFFLDQGYLKTAVDGEKVRMEPGMIVWLPPGVDRELSGKISTHYLRYYKMRFNVRKDGNEVAFSKRALIKRNAWDILPYFQLLAEEYLTPQGYYEEHLIGLLAAFSSVFLRGLGDENDEKRMLNPGQRSIINKHILSNIQSGLSTGDLADALNLTMDYFSRLFKNTYGMAPRTYIKQKRIRYAMMRLTESNISVKELAGELAYDNVNLFCRQFKEAMKLTPSQYRRKFSGPVRDKILH